MNNRTFSFIPRLLVLAMFLLGTWSYTQVSYSTYHQQNNTSKLSFNPVLFAADSITKHFDFQSVALKTNSNFRFSDLVREGTGPLVDSLVLDFPRFRSALDRQNYLDISGEALIFQFGFVTKPDTLNQETPKRPSYFGFAIRQRAVGGFNFNKNYIELLTRGNAPFYDQEFSTGHAGMNTSIYSEISATYARELKDKLWFGLRFKYLMGGLNFTTKKFDLSIDRIEADNYLEVDVNADFRVSGPIEFSLDPYNFVQDVGIESPQEIFSTENSGYAVDLGIVYNLNPDLVFSAAITDIGQIRWSKDVKQLTLDTTYDYYGGDFSNSIDDTESDYKSPEDVIDDLTEDIRNEFGFNLIESAYTEKLPHTFTAGLRYTVMPSLDFGMMYSNFTSPYYYRETLAFSANLAIKNALSLSPTLVLLGNDQLWSCAAGFRVGPLQFHTAISDIGAIKNPAHSQGFGVQMGMSYVFPFALNL